MKKLILLSVLILAFAASIASANPWTTYLTAPLEGQQTGEYYAVQLDVSAVQMGVGDWEWTYTLTNDAGASGLADYGLPIHKFNISIPSGLTTGDFWGLVTPVGWTGNVTSYLIEWTTPDPNGAPIAPGASQTFKFHSGGWPAQLTDAAAINGKSFNGLTYAPAVPEASTLVGFGSALMMAGPGMIGWIRRRKS